jgi:CBS domain-containing protein
MTRAVVTVRPDTPLKDVAAILVRNRISGMPVCAEDGSVVGVVSEADILRKEQGLAPELGRRLAWILRSIDGELDKVTATTAGEAMTAPAVTVEPKQSVAESARLMLDRQINRLPVVADGALVGIVTRADLVRAFDRSDDELEREIRRGVVRETLWIDDRDLDIAVEGGVVALRGRVDTRTDADLLERCVRRVPGIVGVRADLTWAVD